MSAGLGSVWTELSGFGVWRGDQKGAPRHREAANTALGPLTTLVILESLREHERPSCLLAFRCFCTSESTGEPQKIPVPRGAPQLTLQAWEPGTHICLQAPERFFWHCHVPSPGLPRLEGKHHLGNLAKCIPSDSASLGQAPNSALLPALEGLLMQTTLSVAGLQPTDPFSSSLLAGLISQRETQHQGLICPALQTS